MTDDSEFLARYKPDHVYVAPATHGAYATMVGDNEEFIGEVDVTSRCKLAVSAFYVREQEDYSGYKVTKLVFHKRYGWREESSIRLNNFQIAQMQQFTSIISSLGLKEARKVRLSLDNINLDALGPLLSSSKGVELIHKLSSAPELHTDIYAVATKRAALEEFENLLGEANKEGVWQDFFERNPWIFGHGLNYIFLDKVADKLEAVTTGSAFDQHGKRVDGLMKTRAEISQYVLIEIKKSDTELLQTSSYRPGCWTVSHELSDAVTQVHKTVYEFSQNRFRDDIEDKDGNETGERIYCVEPKSYLVIGHQREIARNQDKIKCFELYRSQTRSPEIITFDELFQRAKCIVDNVSREAVDG